MNYQRLFLSGIFLSLFMLSASAKTFIIGNDSTTVRTSDTDYADELEKIRMHMPDIEVGNGISFQPKNKSYKLTMRIRMQNLVDIDFNEKFEAQDIDARVKRLRLRFDGYIYTPKLTYLVQLGFSPYDMKTLPNGNNNIVRDAMIYYVPNSTWNIGFGQTKIRANRARINSSSALQFVDRSIVNSEFNLDRDFGIFDVSGYGMIGVGWTLDSVNFVGGLLRMLFPFSLGLLLSRNFKPVKVRGAFWICSFVLLVLFCVPYVEGGEPICMNGLFEAFCIVVVFPVLIILGASGNTTDKTSTRICKFLGDISFPLYITHYPFMYLFYSWLIENQYFTFEETWQVALCVYVWNILVAYLCLKLYDEPVRRWLSKKFLKKR